MSSFTYQGKQMSQTISGFWETNYLQSFSVHDYKIIFVRFLNYLSKFVYKNYTLKICIVVPEILVHAKKEGIGSKQKTRFLFFFFFI